MLHLVVVKIYLVSFRKTVISAAFCVFKTVKFNYEPKVSVEVSIFDMLGETNLFHCSHKLHGKMSCASQHRHQRTPCAYLWGAISFDKRAVFDVLGIRTGWQGHPSPSNVSFLSCYLKQTVLSNPWISATPPQKATHCNNILAPTTSIVQ